MNLILRMALTFGWLITATVTHATTLDDVRKRDQLNCVVNTGTVGFAAPDARGYWQGVDVDLCRAVAAAVLGNQYKVKFIPTTGQTRFVVLASGEGDILFRNTTVTTSRDAELELTFLPITYYDGQGFLVPKSLGVSHADELDGGLVCVGTGTTTELNLAEFFKINNIKYTQVPIETAKQAKNLYLAGDCNVLAMDISGLASARSTMDNPDDHIILPEIISKEPLGGAVRHGDEEWADIGRWVVYAMIAAEELGITQDNVDDYLKATGQNPNIDRLLGTDGSDIGGMLGLDEYWAVRVLTAVGNYGESFERHIGTNTPIGLERGLNDLWTAGGLLYSPPIK